MFQWFRNCVYFVPLLILTLNVTADDENLWLEKVDDEKALQWVRTQNAITEKALTTKPLYTSLYQDALNALNSKDKLPSISQRGNWIYNFRKDKTHSRGLYRRASLNSFKSGNPEWQTVLDIDQLSQKEDKKWVFKGMSCLEPLYEKCLLRLSPGGGDAYEMREFSTKTMSFIKDGYFLPVAKTRISWIDEDHIYVGSDFGKDSMTDSGYPRFQKIWKRGTDISTAETVLEVNQKSVAARAAHLSSKKGTIDLLIDGLTFWTNRYSELVNGKAVPLNIPETARVVDAIDGQLVIRLQEDWMVEDQNFTQGSVVIVEPSLLRGKGGEIQLLIKENKGSIVEQVEVTSKGIIVVTLEDVKSRLDFYEYADGKWISNRIAMPETGTISIETKNNKTGEFFVRYEDFLTPPTLYSVDTNQLTKVALQQSATFDSSNFKVEQYFTQSKDGTAVPYFVIMNKETQFNGSNPTHIFSYGGFRNSLTPSYSGSYEDLNGAYGKMWLERGGIYVLANIRGGGEYGPSWHSAALLKNKSKSYEDFEAIAEDLIKRKITSPKHLGIEGRSNGGLLVGATMTRRPDLYGAVICGVPLLDMQRYHKLLAGASWMAEFGNPDTDDWEFIKQYSPYQNIKAGVNYPPVFFFTSTRDDRVHPGHARKMAARLLTNGSKIEYYENMEGGHKGSSTSEQLAKRISLAFTHLWTELK